MTRLKNSSQCENGEFQGSVRTHFLVVPLANHAVAKTLQRPLKNVFWIQGLPLENSVAFVSSNASNNYCQSQWHSTTSTEETIGQEKY